MAGLRELGSVAVAGRCEVQDGAVSCELNATFLPLIRAAFNFIQR